MSETTKKALAAFNEGLQNCSSEKEISEYCQMVAAVAIKTIHGIEGRKFKKGFLMGAMKDNEKITIHRRH